MTWDPYRKPLDPEVVDRHDVVVNVAGSPTVGNPHSKKWAENLMNSRVTTTQVLAEAIAASDRQPTFLAGNGIGIYGDHGSQPVTEMADSRGDALLTRVSRAWQAATEPARVAGARVCVLHTAPIHDRRSEPLRVLSLLFKAGLGGPIGDGSQYVPMISARDWVDAVIHLAETDSASGSFNLCCERAPTNEELTRELARLVHRPAFCRVPAFVYGERRGRCPTRCSARSTACRRGCRRAATASPTRTSGPCCARGSTRVADVGHPPGPCAAMERDRPGRRRAAAQRHHVAVIEHLSPGHPVEDPHLESSPVAAQHPDREHLRHQPAYDEPARPVGAQHPGVGPARPGPAHVERTQRIEVGPCPGARSAYVPIVQHLERLDELAASRR